MDDAKQATVIEHNKMTTTTATATTKTTTIKLVAEKSEENSWH